MYKMFGAQTKNDKKGGHRDPPLRKNNINYI